MLFGKSARELPGWKPRPRYSSDSFIALPIRAGREIVGVASVTDRFDAAPFSEETAPAQNHRNLRWVSLRATD